MKIIRPITLEDLESYVAMAFRSGVGLTSIPKDRILLEKKLQKAVEAFQSPEKIEGTYLFVLEDLAKKTIGGICGIMAGHSSEELTYFYKLESALHPTSSNDLSFQILTPISHKNGGSEMCSLYIFPEYRHGGLGKLLSFSRFLFIAAHKKRFQNSLFAVMRGVIDKEGKNPLWEAISRRLIDSSLNDALLLYSKDKNAITPYIPKYPIYTALLPKDAQEVIGKAHSNTQPAMEMLLEEGFSFSYEVDIFDGGPKIIAQVNNIRTIRENKIATVAELTKSEPKSEVFLLSNGRMDFRACMGHLAFDNKGHAVLSEETAKALNISPEQTVSYSPLHHQLKEKTTAKKVASTST